jgi:hypothetical protein
LQVTAIDKRADGSFDIALHRTTTTPLPRRQTASSSSSRTVSYAAGALALVCVGAAALLADTTLRAVAVACALVCASIAVWLFGRRSPAASTKTRVKSVTSHDDVTFQQRLHSQRTASSASAPAHRRIHAKVVCVAATSTHNQPVLHSLWSTALDCLPTKSPTWSVTRHSRLCLELASIYCYTSERTTQWLV